MKYTKEEKMEIGRRIYNDELTRNQAAEEYDIGEYTARDYMRMYRDLKHLPPKRKGRKKSGASSAPVGLPDISQLEALTKEELIRVIIKAGITEKRLKQIIG